MITVMKDRMKMVPTAKVSRTLPYYPNPQIGDLFSDLSCGVVQVEERIKGLFLGAIVGVAIGIVIGSKVR